MYLIEHFPILGIYTYFYLGFFFAWSLGFWLLHGFQNSDNFGKNLSSLCSSRVSCTRFESSGHIYVLCLFVFLWWFKRIIIWKISYFLCLSLLPVHLRRYVHSYKIVQTCCSTWAWKIMCGFGFYMIMDSCCLWEVNPKGTHTSFFSHDCEVHTLFFLPSSCVCISKFIKCRNFCSHLKWGK